MCLCSIYLLTPLLRSIYSYTYSHRITVYIPQQWCGVVVVWCDCCDAVRWCYDGGVCVCCGGVVCGGGEVWLCVGGTVVRYAGVLDSLCGGVI